MKNNDWALSKAREIVELRFDVAEMSEAMSQAIAAALRDVARKCAEIPAELAREWTDDDRNEFGRYDSQVDVCKRTTAAIRAEYPTEKT